MLMGTNLTLELGNTHFRLSSGFISAPDSLESRDSLNDAFREAMCPCVTERSPLWRSSLRVQ